MMKRIANKEITPACQLFVLADDTGASGLNYEIEIQPDPNGKNKSTSRITAEEASLLLKLEGALAAERERAPE